MVQAGFKSHNTTEYVVGRIALTDSNRAGDGDRVRDPRHSVTRHSSYQSTPASEREAGDLHVHSHPGS